jgi:TonB family protein
MPRSLVHRAFGFALLVGFLAASIPAAAGSDLDQHLRDQYQGKTQVLRGFYSGSSLRYDSTGSPAEVGGTSDWTIDGLVQVNEVRVSGGHLKIRATRLHLGWLAGEFQALHDKVGPPAEDEKKNRDLRIEAALGSGPTDESVTAALSRIFLTPQDSFADLVPEYWKPCVRAGLTGQPEDKKPSCHFSAEFLAVPGVVGHSDSRTETTGGGSQQTSSAGVFPIGHGVSPPKVLNQNEPEYSDAARRSKFQGTITLKLEVDPSGTPTNIRILSPLGCGLDAQAVKTVASWRFKPSEKDGVPVRVEIAVEVDFHLY